MPIATASRSLLHAAIPVALLIAFLILTRVLYFLSYPLIISGDGSLYYDMIAAERSSLLLAGGYPFLGQLPRKLATILGLELGVLLALAQQLVVALGIVWLYLSVSRVYSRWVALLAAFLIATDFVLLSSAGHTRPEFLQATLLMALLASLLWGFQSAALRPKLVWYGMAGALAMMAYLTKYNAIVAGVLLAVPCFDRGLQVRNRLWAFTAAGAAAFVVLFSFLALFHHPSTQAWGLNKEHGWIYLKKLHSAGIPLNPDNGIQTLRFLLLVNTLPKREGAGEVALFHSINQVPQLHRDQQRIQFRRILVSVDESALRQEWGRMQGATSSLREIDFFKLYHHLGLDEAERIIFGVFREGIVAYRGRYAANVATAFWKAVNLANNRIPYSPVFESELWWQPQYYYSRDNPKVIQTDDPLFPPVRQGYSSLEGMRTLDAPLRFVGRPEVWEPGSRWLTVLSWPAKLPSAVIWIVLMGAFLAQAGRRFQRRPDVFFVLGLVALLGGLGFSSLLLYFREKELIFLTPLIHFLFAVGLAEWVARVERFVRWIRTAPAIT